MLGLARRVADSLATLSALFGAAALVVIVSTVLIDVIGRYFGAPLYGAQDIVQMAAVFVVIGGMAFVERRGGHIQVDILAGVFPDRLNRLLTLLGCVLGAVCFALITWQMLEASKLARLLNMATNLLSLPRAPFQYAVAAMSAVACLTLSVKAVALVRGGE